MDEVKTSTCVYQACEWTHFDTHHFHLFLIFMRCEEKEQADKKNVVRRYFDDVLMFDHVKVCVFGFNQICKQVHLFGLFNQICVLLKKSDRQEIGWNVHWRP